jgi:hypothetical protein
MSDHRQRQRGAIDAGAGIIRSNSVRTATSLSPVGLDRRRQYWAPPDPPARMKEPTSVDPSSAHAPDCQCQGAAAAGLASRAEISKIAIPLTVVATTVVAFKSKLSNELSITKYSGLGGTSFATQTHCLS